MSERRPARLLIVTAFAVIYIVWGSTYLAIRLVIETIPPLAMAGVRFLVAGLVLLPWACRRGDHADDRLISAHWRSAVIIGALLVGGGSGGLTYAEEHLTSGMVALVMATIPLWMAVLAHIRGVQRIGRLGVAGLVGGLLGVGLLARPDVAGAGQVGWIVFTLLAALSWALGSIYARRAQLPRRPLLGISMQMLCGGAILCIAAAMTGEWDQIHLNSVSPVSALAFLYLVLAGSLAAYTAYLFLLGTVSPRAASSYAYVNPLEAVFLGWAFLGESVTLGTLVAAGLIVTAVMLLMAGTHGPPSAEVPTGSS